MSTDVVNRSELISRIPMCLSVLVFIEGVILPLLDCWRLAAHCIFCRAFHATDWGTECPERGCRRCDISCRRWDNVGITIGYVVITTGKVASARLCDAGISRHLPRFRTRRDRPRATARWPCERFSRSAMANGIRPRTPPRQWSLDPFAVVLSRVQFGDGE